MLIVLRSSTPRRGFTLVELMVALLVLVVGVMGALTLLWRAGRGASDALARTQAAQFTQAFADILLSNPVAVRAGAFDNVTANAPGVAPPQPPACVPCSAADMAQADVARWQAIVATSLAGGAGAVSCTADAGGARTCAVTLQWRERFAAEGASSPAQSSAVAVIP